MKNTTLLHVALQYNDEKKAETFYKDVLGLEFVREFVLKPDASRAIFAIDEEVKVKTYANDKTMFEIFITPRKPVVGFEHTCVMVEDKDELLARCRKYNVEVITHHMNNKEYLFIKDYSGYIYEIKW